MKELMSLDKNTLKGMFLLFGLITAIVPLVLAFLTKSTESMKYGVILGSIIGAYVLHDSPNFWMIVMTVIGLGIAVIGSTAFRGISIEDANGKMKRSVERGWGVLIRDDPFTLQERVRIGGQIGALREAANLTREMRFLEIERREARKELLSGGTSDFGGKE